MIDIQKLKASAQRCVELDSHDKIDAIRVISVEPAAVLELIKEVEMLRKGWYENESTDLRFWPEEMDELKAENEALRKDAERYRWLRMFTIKGVSLNVAGALESLDRQIDDLSKEASHD